MRILHIITRLDRGGSSDNTLLSCIGQLGRGHEVTLLVGENLTEESSLVAEAEAAGVTLIRLPSLVRSVRPLQDLAALWHCHRLIRKGRFELVHTHTSKAGIVGRTAAALAGGCKIVHTPHGHVFYGYFGPLKTRIFIWAERLTALWTDAIVTLTDREAIEHLAVGVGRSSQFVTIFSGIPLPAEPGFSSDAERQARRRELALPERGALIASVGRLDPIKGHGTLIRAFSELGAEHGEAHLVLIGDGEEREAYASLAEKLGASDRILFLGWRQDVNDLLGVMDLFVLPSINEGLGRAVLEAMAACLPVIASRVGGVPQVVDEGETGILVPPNEPSRLAQAMGELLSQPERRNTMARAGRKKAEAFSAEAMCERIESLYQNLFAPHTPAGAPA